MELHTERLLLRTICPEDWIDLKRIWNDFGKSEYAKYDVPHDKSDDEIKEQARKWHDNDFYFAVCLKEEGPMIGYLASHQNDAALDVGYCFDSAYHRHGYAKESILAFIRYFHQRGIDTFTAGTGLKNTPSVKLLNSLGFQQVGIEQVSFYKDESGNPIYFEGGIFERKLNKTPESVPAKDKKHDSLANYSQADMPDFDFGQTLKHYRGKSGYNQQTAAKQLHISRQLLSCWENNQRIPDHNNLEKLSDLYQVPLEKLTCKLADGTSGKPASDVVESGTVESGADYQSGLTSDDIITDNTTDKDCSSDESCEKDEHFRAVLLLAIIVLLFLSNSVPVLGALIPIGYFLFRRKLTSRPVWLNALALLCLFNQMRSLFVYVSHWIQVGKW